MGKQWQTHVQGTKMFKFSQKLKRTKQHIKIWARNFLGNNQQKLILNAQKLEKIEEKLSHQPHNFRLNDWLHKMLRQREKLLLFNQKYWVLLEERNGLLMETAIRGIFNNKANMRRKRKLICKLKDDCGLWIDNPRTITEKFVHDYTNRFLSNGHGSTVMPDPQSCTRISDSDNSSLIKILDMMEVKSALLSIDSSKTPGADGFGVGFFK